MATLRGELDLVDVVEISRRAGTTPGTVHSWRRRHASFPAPLVVLAIGPIWTWAPVRDWLGVARRPGRPSTRLAGDERDLPAALAEADPAAG